MASPVKQRRDMEVGILMGEQAAAMERLTHMAEPAVDMELQNSTAAQ
jgi:hypothetical protein